MNNSISKHLILRGKKDFGILFSSGSFIKGNLINAVYVDGSNFRIGFAVSKRVKGAVKRNRVKRQLREVFRTNKNIFPKDKWIVLIGKCEVENFDELCNDVITVVKQINY